jgi:hypothetical protein
MDSATSYDSCLVTVSAWRQTMPIRIRRNGRWAMGMDQAVEYTLSDAAAAN